MVCKKSLLLYTWCTTVLRAIVWYPNSRALVTIFFNEVPWPHSTGILRSDNPKSTSILPALERNICVIVVYTMENTSFQSARKYQSSNELWCRIPFILLWDLVKFCVPINTIFPWISPTQTIHFDFNNTTVCPGSSYPNLYNDLLYKLG